nr:uncharacterized protein LOC113714304 [Coffea arabica]
MTSKVIVFLLGLCLAVPITCLPEYHRVTWQRGIDPASSLQFVILRVGDYLDFINPEALPIAEVGQTDYAHCTWTDVKDDLPPDAVVPFKLTESRTYYFAADPFFCYKGLKLQAQVYPA